MFLKLKRIKTIFNIISKIEKFCKEHPEEVKKIGEFFMKNMPMIVEDIEELKKLRK